MACEIRAEQGDGVLRLDAAAHAVTLSRGHYRFVVEKRSAAGTSRTVQQGEFTLADGRDEVLASVALEPAAAGHYRAELVLQSGQETSTCTAP